MSVWPHSIIHVHIIFKYLLKHDLNIRLLECCTGDLPVELSSYINVVA